jgi:phosphoribosylformylglycinamidine synthase PurS subunit
LFKVTVIVRRKPAILDPQGKAAQQGAKLLGFENVRNTRIGKYIEFDVDSTDLDSARKEVEAYCEKLLTNPIIEDFEYKLEKYDEN